MTGFLFVRHGETDANKNGMLAAKKDEPLNETGKSQAQAAAKALRGQKLGAVYCGNALRVRQTFEIIRDSMIFDDLFFTDEIREMDLGDWEGKDFKQAAAENPAQWAAYMKDWPGFSFPNGESLRDYFAFCGAFITNLAKKHEGGKTAVFGHKGFILACACVLEGRPMEKLFDRDIKTGAYFFVKCAE
jgi:broad specificity phosphatase PhoE